MKKAITIYELLGLIKNNKAPKKIIYDGYTYEFLQNGCVLDDFNYFSIINGFLYNEIDFENHLNDKVEIIEEDKKIEKLPKHITDNACATKDFRTIANKINELIDTINELKGKSE